MPFTSRHLKKQRAHSRPRRLPANAVILSAVAHAESFGSFPWKKLGGALRNTEAKEKLTLFLHRLRRHPIFPKGATFIYHFPFTIFSAPFHHYRGPPPPVKRWEARLRRKRPLRHYAYLSTPVWGWVASGARRKGVASAGSYKNGAPYFRRAPSSIYHLPFTIFSGPLPPLSWSPSPVK